ncbi:hypothetical protein [Haloglomus litoreum]|uniref:hypothetical protein n=1 Tax=Haloglomus litoreum TaxID=3034026 RepID=UPI0023E7766E|nr:hypothetical protein [Haloglomus sp. DT116]
MSDSAGGDGRPDDEGRPASDPPPTDPPDVSDDTVGATLFTYGAPFLGVLLVAVGIGAAVPGAYGLIQEDIADCGDPSISVDPVEEQFAGEPPDGLRRFTVEELAPAERRAVRRALDDPLGEAHVRGEFRNRPAFENGTLVDADGRTYYATIVAEHPCFETAPLQFPLGVFAIALGVVGILTPPGYRRLVALEERIRE